MEKLYNLLMNSKHGDKNSTLIILEKFNPLLNKYCRKLNYDGSYTDLIICLLETIKTIPIENNAKLRNDSTIVAYLHISIKHKYINLSKKNCAIISNETELNTDILGENSYNYIDEKLFIKEIVDKLSDFQKHIIKSIYINNIPESTLAKQMNVSRQAINRIKNRALNNLRKTLC